MNKSVLFTMGACLFAIASVLLLGACEVIDTPDNAVFTADSSGHFTQDLVYTVYSNTITYASDGTYSNIASSYDTDTSTDEISYGYKGTYTYDNSTKTITITYSEQFNSTSDSWEDYSGTSTQGLILTEREEYSVYTKDSNGAYVRNYEIVYEDESSYKTITSMQFSSDLSTNQYNKIEYDYASDSSLSDATKTVITYHISKVYPTGTTSLANGGSYTLNYNYYDYEEYTSTTETFADEADSTGSVGNSSPYSFVLSSDGKYLYVPTTTSMLFSRELK